MMKRHTMRVSQLCWGLLFLGSLGCKEKPGSEAEAKANAKACSADAFDQDLVDAEIPCIAQDDCPCSTHCSLGRCISACDTCDEGESCDVSGRCFGEVEIAQLPSSSPAQLRPSVVALGDTGEAHRVSLVLRSEQAIRALAPKGALVSCQGAEGSFKQECLLDKAKIHQELFIKRSDDLEKDEALEGALLVFSQTEQLSVSLYDEVPAISPDREGLYTGTARMVHTSVAGQEVSPTFEFPVSATIFGGAQSHLAEVSDKLGLFRGPEPWQIELRQGDDAWTVSDQTVGIPLGKKVQSPALGSLDHFENVQLGDGGFSFELTRDSIRYNRRSELFLPVGLFFQPEGCSA